MNCYIKAALWLFGAIVAAVAFMVVVSWGCDVVGRWWNRHVHWSCPEWLDNAFGVFFAAVILGALYFGILTEICPAWRKP